MWTVREITYKIQCGHSAMEGIIKELRLSKVCACWVPRLLIDDMKQQRRDMDQELLRNEERGDAFLTMLLMTKAGYDTSTHTIFPQRRTPMQLFHQRCIVLMLE